MNSFVPPLDSCVLRHVLLQELFTCMCHNIMDIHDGMNFLMLVLLMHAGLGLYAPTRWCGCGNRLETKQTCQSSSLSYKQF